MPSINNLSDFGPPISDWGGRLLIVLTVVAFIYVVSSTTRPLYLRLVVTIMAVSDIYLLLTMPHITGHIPGFDQLIANFVFAGVLRIIDILFLRDEAKLLRMKDDEAVGTASHKKVIRRSTGDMKKNAGTRIAPMRTFQAFDYLVINHRNVSTPYQIKNLPRFSKSDPTYVPSRHRFLLNKLSTLLVAYLILDLLTCQPAPDLALFSSDQEYFFRRLHEVTWREIGFRILTNFNLWASCTCLIQYIYAIVALVCVGSGFWEPLDFPPLIGRVKDDYSIRNHWGKCWHQVFQAPFVNTANALTNLAFTPLPPTSPIRRSLISRYLKMFFVFSLSGVGHVISPLGNTQGWPQLRESLFFFPMQTVGIIIEDLAIAAYRNVTRKKENPWWIHYVGYLWVFCWTSYTCSIWVYPVLRRGGEGMIPYSFVRMAYDSAIWGSRDTIKQEL